MSRLKLVLSDGFILEGDLFGYKLPEKEVIKGEVVFNTSMSGYQEIMTDPSYAGQIMTFTNSYIGNTGINEIDNESDSIHITSMICRNYSKTCSNYRATSTLEDYLIKNKITALENVDTRKLVKHLRDNGSKLSIIANSLDYSNEELITMSQDLQQIYKINYVKKVSTNKEYDWKQGVFNLETNSFNEPKTDESSPLVAVLDCGVKFNILRLLVDSGFRVKVLPAYSTKEDILKLNPSGLFISNGPGDPALLTEIVDVVESLLGQIPIFGICLGHQILSQANGAKTYKLKFGHRGANHPVLNKLTGKIDITVQNHGYAVDPKTLKNEKDISYINLNDQTIEGLKLKDKHAFSVQHHPEASPGPQDCLNLFDKFYKLVENYA